MPSCIVAHHRHHNRLPSTCSCLGFSNAYCIFYFCATSTGSKDFVSTISRLLKIKMHLSYLKPKATSIQYCSLNDFSNIVWYCISILI
jgi:hypothetical protein